MSNNNIFNTDYRRKFLKLADLPTLNEYLKNMERLSLKGGKYLDIYNSDVEYLINMNDSVFLKGGGFLDVFFGKQEVQKPVCDTEAAIKKINDITQNSYCSLYYQQTKKCDNRCLPRLDEIDSIRSVLQKENTCVCTGKDWIKAIHKFIDVVICCGSFFSKDEFEPFRTVYFKDIVKLLTTNEKFLKETYKYLSKIIQNENSIISDDFIREYHILRAKKSTTPIASYNEEKEALIKKYLTTFDKLGDNGFSIIYTSKLVEKIRSSFKRMNSKPKLT